MKVPKKWNPNRPFMPCIATILLRNSVFFINFAFLEHHVGKTAYGH